MKKKILSLILALCMMVSFVPSEVLADGEPIYSEYSVSYDFTLGNGTDKAHIATYAYSDTNGFWLYSCDKETASGQGAVNLLTKKSEQGIEAAVSKNRTAKKYWFAIDIYVPADGKYKTKLTSSKRTVGGIADIFLLDGDKTQSEIEAAIVSDTYKLGAVNFGDTETDRNMTTEYLSDTPELEGGKWYTLVFRAEAGNATNGICYMYLNELTFEGGDKSAVVSMFSEENGYVMEPGVSKEIKASDFTVYGSSGGIMSSNEISMIFASLDESVAMVSDDGILLGVGEGATKITVTAKEKDGDSSASIDLDATVYTPVLTSVVLSADKYDPTISEVVTLTAKGVYNNGLSEKTLADGDVTFDIVEGEAIIDGNRVTVSGQQTIKITATSGGITSEPITINFLDLIALGYSPYTINVDFRIPTQKNLSALTREDTKGMWMLRTITPGTTIGTLNANNERMYLGTSLNSIETYASWVAFDIYIPYAGKYMTEFSYAKYNNNGEGGIYILPGDTKDEEIGGLLVEENKIGHIDYYDQNGYKAGFVERIDDVEFGKSGEYILVFKAEKKLGGASMFPSAIKFYGEDGITLASVLTDKESITLPVGEKDKISVKSVFRTDKSIAGADEYEITFASLDETIATVDPATGEVTALKQGNTDIVVTAIEKDSSVAVSYAVQVSVLNLELSEITLEADSFEAPCARKIPISVNLDFNNGLFVREAEDSELRYNIEGDATVVDGRVRAGSVGTVSVSATYTFSGVEYTSNAVTLNFTESTKKTEPTYFTYEKRAQVKVNAEKYSWVSDTVKSTIRSADQYIANLDSYYNGIFGEGIPRSAQVGSENDPQWQFCRYCGSNIGEKYTGNNGDGYSISPVAKPWKIQCHDCKRYFPSNDFGLLYERGLDEHGYYDRDRAVATNAEAVARGEKDALKNELYPEIIESNVDPRGNEITWGGGPNLGSVVDPTTGKAIPGGMMWGVDDGLGYLPGREYDNGLKERHTYIAFYGYYYWYQIRYVTTALANAYVYTDDPKYGRAGALLIDRVADVFPSFSFRQWDNDFLVSHGGSGYGKIAGRINDCQMTQGWITCADAFFPILSDETLIKTLSEKSKKFNLSNPKTSADLIWENWSDGILRETFKACKEINISGNYGMQQWALSSAALVLDSEPESREMVEWVFRTETEEEAAAIMADPNFKSFAGNGRVLNKDGTEYCVGGYLGTTLVDSVDRDGMGNEGSPNYNLGWALRLYPAAEMLNMYTDDPKYNIYKNPKFMKMFTAGIPLALTNTHTAQIGDSGATAGIGFLDRDETIFAGFENLKDTEVGKSLAKYIYIRNGYSAEGLKYGIFHPDPGSMETDVLKLVDGEDLTFPSALMSGFGYAVLRDGAIYGEEGNSTYKNNMRDFWLYFGGSTISHAHYDTLNLGIEAFGLNMAPDIGYPEKTGNNPNRMTWVSTTLSHNTVLVDTAQPAGKLATTADPLHFDDSGAVKLMDVDASDAYAQTDIYRRTLVMVEAGPDVSYGVDFFRIKGGDEHLYSFHSQSNTISETSGLELVPQTDEDGNYIGSYAGADVPYGEDPSGSYIISQLKYPAGYTWFKNVRRASDVGKFTVDFVVSDYNKVLKDSKNLHLRMTMLNDFELSEVALAGGYVLKKSVTANLPETLEYVLAKRKGNDLDSLYTTVYEPYKADRYISDMNSVLIETEDSVGEDDTAKAIKVIRQDGRVDYITYATNNKALYTVADGDISFKFRGFVGVYSVNAEGKAIYSYVHDGDVIGDNISEIGAVEGSVSGFERELVTSNYIDIETSKEVNPDELAGKYIFVENDGVRNAVYKIESAEKTENGARLDIGLTSVIRGYASQYNPDAGYVYDVGEGQRISIPLSGIYDGAPVFDEIKNKLTATAGSGIMVKLNAESDIGCDITYVADTLPRGATIDEIAGTITWKPTSSQIGDNHFAVIARDSEGRTTTAHFIVTVYGSTTGGGNNAAGTDGSGSASGAGSGGGGGAGGGAATAPSKPTEPEKPVEPETPAESETPEVEEKTFTDLENHAWAEDAINVLAKEGIIKGTTSATFSPANNITRSDFAILLVRAFELESENAENFADVADNDYFAKELAIARNNGIINGIGDNKFAPRNTITRQDMMTIVYRALVKLGVELNETTNVEMPDADAVATYAEEAVNALIGAGLVNGKSGKIAPTDYTTRAEVAVLIKRILDFKSTK